MPSLGRLRGEGDVQEEAEGADMSALQHQKAVLLETFGLVLSQPEQNTFPNLWGAHWQALLPVNPLQMSNPLSGEGRQDFN